MPLDIFVADSYSIVFHTSRLGSLVKRFFLGNGHFLSKEALWSGKKKRATKQPDEHQKIRDCQIYGSNRINGMQWNDTSLKQSGKEIIKKKKRLTKRASPTIGGKGRRAILLISRGICGGLTCSFVSDRVII